MAINKQSRIWKIAAIAACIALSIGLFFFFKGTASQDDIKALKGDLQRYRDEDAIRAAKVDSAFQVIARLDSAGQELRNRIDGYENGLTNIKQRYDKKRTDLSALPLTEQFQFFTEWVSAPDKIR